MILPARSRRPRSSADTRGRRSALDRKPDDERQCAPTITFSRTGMRAEHRQVLEGAAHAQPGDLVRGRAGDRLAFEEDVAGLVLVQAAEAVEQRGLAGAVGADQPADVAALDVEAHAVERHDAAEAHGHATHAEQGFRAGRHGGLVSFVLVWGRAPAGRSERVIGCRCAFWQSEQSLSLTRQGPLLDKSHSLGAAAAGARGVLQAITGTIASQTYTGPFFQGLLRITAQAAQATAGPVRNPPV